MNKERQRQVIAEACGFTDIHRVEQSCLADALWVGKAPGSLSDATWVLPDYLNDLNAMREAEEILYVHQSQKPGEPWHWMVYYDHLVRLTGLTIPLRATAAQRAEAFLRTIGKWEEEAV